jgi:hypothetical protein
MRGAIPASASAGRRSAQTKCAKNSGQYSVLAPSLVLAQNRNDLLLCEPDPFHRSSLQSGRTLNLLGGKSQWQVLEVRPNFL